MGINLEIDAVPSYNVKVIENEDDKTISLNTETSSNQAVSCLEKLLSNRIKNTHEVVETKKVATVETKHENNKKEMTKTEKEATVETTNETHHQNNKIATTNTEKETHVVKKVIKKLSHKNKILKTHHQNNKIASTKTKKETHVVKKVIKNLSHKQTETKKVSHVNTQIKTHHE